MPGIDRSLPQQARPLIEPRPTPLLTRLAAAHGDAEVAAKLLDEASRCFQADIERLMVANEQAENAPAPARPKVRVGIAAKSRRRSPALGAGAAPAPAG